MWVVSRRCGWSARLLLLASFCAMNAFGAKSINLTANLPADLPAEYCLNCATDLAPQGSSGPYSLLSDGAAYASGGVQSQILTHNAVYTLDTTSTLVNGLIGAGTRTVQIHFWSPVEGTGSDVLPACWGGSHDQEQAVNWSVVSHAVKFPAMVVGSQYPGFARLDFNVRNGVCDKQVFRFYLRYYSVCITRTAAGWVVTSDSCGTEFNYGTAGLNGQGGKKGQTVYYGDWRVPFKLTLTQ